MDAILERLNDIYNMLQYMLGFIFGLIIIFFIRKIILRFVE